MATFFACLPDTIRKEWLFPDLSAAQGIFFFNFFFLPLWHLCALQCFYLR